MSIIEKLTEGIVRRDLAKEGAALLNKWERTGLLEGLESDVSKNNMASLLENQAKELLREASIMSAGDVEGFAAVAFPIVRRVFGSLIANDLVSVQPMSLPSGLIFFLDFTFQGDNTDATTAQDRIGYKGGDSLYGQGVLGSEITGGAQLNSLTEDNQPYGIQSGYSSATGSTPANLTPTVFVASGTVGTDDAIDKLVRFDPDLAAGTKVIVHSFDLSNNSSSVQADRSEQGLRHLVAVSTTAVNGRKHGVVAIADEANIGSDYGQIRRLTQLSGTSKDVALMFFTGSVANGTLIDAAAISFTHVSADDFSGASTSLGAVLPQDTWGLEAATEIPEIEIKVDSVSVTAVTKKLKAKWSPELGQDLNAYHNLDAEVELTSILSEQIALEIDREILGDLIGGAKAATYYWSRSPGLFVRKDTGAELGAASAAPDFTGTVSEWYETLIETINDVSAQIHRKTLRGGANFLVCGPETANILEFTSGFRANISHADEKGTVGAVNVGSISKKFDVMVDPYFPRNVVLVGRKGNSFLESGYVYAPYVPLQVTPTIFGTEDFVPRKGVMTRYAKKMVRPDMYGLVVIRGMLGEAGAS